MKVTDNKIGGGSSNIGAGSGGKSVWLDEAMQKINAMSVKEFEMFLKSCVDPTDI